MRIKLDDFRAKLISKILCATSQDEVDQIIASALKAMQENRVDGYIIARFVDKTYRELVLLNPINKDAQQWSNISMAKIILNRIHIKLHTVVT